MKQNFKKIALAAAVSATVVAPVTAEASLRDAIGAVVGAVTFGKVNLSKDKKARTKVTEVTANAETQANANTPADVDKKRLEQIMAECAVHGSGLSSVAKDSCVSDRLSEIKPAEQPKAEQPAETKPTTTATTGTDKVAEQPAPTSKAEEPKAEATAEQPKVEEPKAEQPAETKPTTTAPVATTPKAEEPKVEAPKAEQPAETDAQIRDRIKYLDNVAKNEPAKFMDEYLASSDAVRKQVSDEAVRKDGEFKADKPEELKVQLTGAVDRLVNGEKEAPKAEQPKVEEPKVEAPKAEEPKEQPKAEEPKAEQPAPVVEAPKVTQKGAGVVAEEVPEVDPTQVPELQVQKPVVPANAITLAQYTHEINQLKDADTRLASKVDANTQAIKDLDKRLTDRVDNLEQRTNERFSYHERKYSAGIASTLAFAAIPTHTQGHHAGVGVGYYNDQVGVALAATGALSDRVAYKAGATFANKEAAAAVGLTYRF